MPCDSGQGMYTGDHPSRGDFAGLLNKHDKLTAEVDQLREIVLALAAGEAPSIPAEFLKQIQKNQVEHRKVDLKRLEATFIKKKDNDRLAKVWAANPNKPLEPQLGFNPDDF